MQVLLKKPYGLFLFVTMLCGMELFIWFYLLQTGYLHDLIGSDKSHVSLIIIVVYLLGTMQFVYSSLVTSTQFVELQQIDSHPCRNLTLKRFFQRLETMEQTGDKHQTLIDVLDTRLRGTYAFGFIVADLMLKLGILGTVIGFIIMLGSLSNLNSVDITVMQTLLAEMSGGMRVALYTTLSGMLAGIILNIKFNLLDWSVDHLVNDIKETIVSR